MPKRTSILIQVADCMAKQTAIAHAQKALEDLDEKNTLLVRALDAVRQCELDVLRSERDAMLKLDKVRELAGPHVSRPNEQRRTPVAPGSRAPDVQVIEDVLRDHGPMHIRQLVPLVEAAGVSLSGRRKEPKELLRVKMLGSKRFHLLGNNVWGLREQADWIGGEPPEGFVQESLAGRSSQAGNVVSLVDVPGTGPHRPDIVIDRKDGSRIGLEVKSHR